MLLNRGLRAAALAMCALTLSAPAAAELIRVNDSGFVSRHEVVVKASPKAVWLALIAPAGWWRSDHTWSGSAENLTLTPQAGGCFCETIPEVNEPDRFTLQGSVEHMRVLQAYPEQALRMQGALGPLQSEPVVGILTVVISTVDSGTRIVWEYNVGGTMRYEVPVISKTVDGVMGEQLAALSLLLEPVAKPQSDVQQPAQSGGQDAAMQQGAEAADPAPAPAKVFTLPPDPARKTPSKAATVEGAFGDLKDVPEG